jgi:predicted nuclease of predicted toxin-antitoxin system
MKLLFDQNIASRLVGLLNNLYPDSQHLSQLGMESAGDTAVWN